MECRGDVVEVLGVETSDGDTAIGSHVDGKSLAELSDLLLVKTSVGEHANLAGNVAPVVLVAKFLQLGDEARAHVSHTT